MLRDDFNRVLLMYTNKLILYVLSIYKITTKKNCSYNLIPFTVKNNCFTTNSNFSGFNF